MLSICKRRLHDCLDRLREQTSELAIRIAMAAFAAVSGLFVALFFYLVFRAYETIAGR